MFTAADEYQEILGFMIDDFCVQSEHLWESVGTQLIEKITASSKAKDVAQILVVCGAYDYPKRKFLMNQNLSIAFEEILYDQNRPSEKPSTRYNNTCKYLA